MTKFKTFLLAAGILLFAYAGWHVEGIALAIVGEATVYLISLRTHPRTRHTGWFSCGGSGEVRSKWWFPWAFHRCSRCQSGRIVRWGAGHWGSPASQLEWERGRMARRAAKDQNRWR